MQLSIPIVMAVPSGEAVKAEIRYLPSLEHDPWNLRGGDRTKDGLAVTECLIDPFVVPTLMAKFDDIFIFGGEG